MKAIILAAGRGSRMGNMTDERSKCLVELNQRPLLEWQLGALKAAGIHDVTIVTGYKKEKLEGRGVSTLFNPEWSTSNMVVSLLCAASLFDEPTIVSYSDIIYDASIVRRLIDAPEELSVVYDTAWLELWQRRSDSPLNDAESFSIDESGRILDIGLRVDAVEKIMGQYLGLLKIEPSAMRWIVELVDKNPGIRDALDMTALLSRLLGEGRLIYGVQIKGGWCEVDNESDLEVAESLVREGKLRLS